APDRSAVLSLTVAHEDAASLKQTPDEYANWCLALAKAEPFNKHEKGAIGGIPADSYYSRIVKSGGVSVSALMNVIKPGHDYIIAETIITTDTINSTQQRTLVAVLKGITLAGVTSNQTRAEAPLNPAHGKTSNRAKTSPNPTRTEAPSTPNSANASP